MAESRLSSQLLLVNTQLYQQIALLRQFSDSVEIDFIQLFNSNLTALFKNNASLFIEIPEQYDELKRPPGIKTAYDLLTKNAQPKSVFFPYFLDYFQRLDSPRAFINNRGILMAAASHNRGDLINLMAERLKQFDKPLSRFEIHEALKVSAINHCEISFKVLASLWHSPHYPDPPEYQFLSERTAKEPKQDFFDLYITNLETKELANYSKAISQLIKENQDSLRICLLNAADLYLKDPFNSEMWNSISRKICSYLFNIESGRSRAIAFMQLLKAHENIAAVLQDPRFFGMQVGNETPHSFHTYIARAIKQHYKAQLEFPTASEPKKFMQSLAAHLHLESKLYHQYIYKKRLISL